MDTYFGHTDPINDMDIYVKGKPFTGSADKTARFWKTNLDSHLVFQKSNCSVDCVTVLEQEKYASSGQDRNIHVWSATSRKPYAYADQAHDEWITALSCLRGTDLLLSGSSDGYVKTWQVPGGNKKDLVNLENIPVKGVVNQIAQSKSFFACAVGQEHKHGRWNKVSGAKNGLCLIKYKHEGGATKESK